MAELIVEVVEGQAAGQQVPLSNPVELGRGTDVGLTLDDEQVSRHHARISPSGAGAVVEDLGSTNGTYVNDQPIHGPRELVAGDRVRVGLSVIELRSREQVAVQPSGIQQGPSVTVLGQGVLVPASEREMGPPPSDVDSPSPAQDRGGPALRSEELEPAFVPRAAVEQTEHSPEYEAILSLVDRKVKRRTSVAAMALLAIAGLAVVIYFGVRFSAGG